MLLKRYCLLLFLSFLFSSCATVFKGYYDKVSIIDPPKDLKITTSEGISIPCMYDSTMAKSKDLKTWNESYVARNYYILLRNNQQHTLTFKSAEFEKTIVVYPKIGGGWLIIDTVTGILPVFIDMYTGSFNHFDPIDLNWGGQ
jgi:hypothetical protein